MLPYPAVACYCLLSSAWEDGTNLSGWSIIACSILPISSIPCHQVVMVLG